MTLVAFDFDGTLADSEMLDRLAARHGVGDEVAEITERAMRGNSPIRRASGGARETRRGPLERRHRGRLRRRPPAGGAGDLIRSLRDAGVTVVVLTGGFAPGVEAALEAADAEADSVVANRLPADDDGLTGDVEGRSSRGRRTTRSGKRAGSSTRRPRRRSPLATAPTTFRCSRRPGSRSASSRNPASTTTATSPSRRWKNWRNCSGSEDCSAQACVRSAHEVTVDSTAAPRPTATAFTTRLPNATLPGFRTAC